MAASTHFGCPKFNFDQSATFIFQPHYQNISYQSISYHSQAKNTLACIHRGNLLAKLLKNLSSGFQDTGRDAGTDRGTD
jgi:hypothetical protein